MGLSGRCAVTTFASANNERISEVQRICHFAHRHVDCRLANILGFSTGAVWRLIDWVARSNDESAPRRHAK